MKRIIILFLFCTLCSIGCQNRKPKLNEDQLLEDLKNNIVYQDELASVKESMVYHLYTLDREETEQIIVYTSSGATAEEFAIIKTSNPASAKEAIMKRLEDKKRDFANYLPAELKKLEVPLIITNGNYVILCIAQDATQAEEVLKKYK